MTDIPTIYADDPDPTWTFTVTDSQGDDVDWATPVVAIDDGAYEVTGEWQGAAAPSRQIKVPLDDLAAGIHRLYLRVPNGVDILLGKVNVQPRV